MKVAVLGLGAMGSRMTVALLRAGHSLTVWNRTAERLDDVVKLGAKSAESPAVAVSEADVVLAMLRDDSASKRVWLGREDGALAALPNGAIAMECSTLSPAWVRELSSACAAKRIAFLDAPVVGSRAQADAAQLIHLVGGDASIVERAASVFSATGSKAHHVGPVGAGATLKLLVNAMLGVQVALMGELLGASRTLGLEAHRVVDVLSQLPVCSPVAKVSAEAMLKQMFAPAFPVELMSKDLSYLTSSFPPRDTPITDAARAVFERALNSKMGSENMTAVAKLYQVS